MFQQIIISRIPIGKKLSDFIRNNIPDWDNDEDTTKYPDNTIKSDWTEKNVTPEWYSRNYNNGAMWKIWLKHTPDYMNDCFENSIHDEILIDMKIFHHENTIVDLILIIFQ